MWHFNTADLSHRNIQDAGALISFYKAFHLFTSLPGKIFYNSERFWPAKNKLPVVTYHRLVPFLVNPLKWSRLVHPALCANQCAVLNKQN